MGDKNGCEQKSYVVATHQKSALGAGKPELFFQRGDLR
jgi:hypothetical protein